MKPKFITTLKQRIAASQKTSLVAGLLLLGLSATVLPVLAQSSNSPTPPDRHQMGKDLLNLSADQKAKLEQIHQAEQAQMDSILTTEQKAQLQTARDNRTNPRQVFDSLNLTAEQKTKIQELRRSTREQMDAILTAEQRQQLQNHHRGGPHGQNWLNLSAEQQAKMEQIHQSERSQMDSILTTEQKAQLQTARNNRENPRQAFDSLNLTAEQKTKIQELRRSTKAQMDAILTPAQLQQLQQHQPPEGAPAAP